MNRMQTFQQFLATQSAQISILGFVINLFLVALLSFILSRMYIKYGYSLSNRRIFAKNFMLITITTMFMITIVKSSLALSLGLVGALSIVRFRTAIKEPEELAYLFFAIAIGLGFGADQRIITIVAFVVICGIIALMGLLRRYEDSQNLYLTVAASRPHKISLEQIVDILKKYCSVVDMKRFDETEEVIEASFLIEFNNFKQLQIAKSELQRVNSSIKITFLDNRGVL